MGAGALNARWVRERRIEVVAPVATLETELGTWTLRRGVVPDDVPVREVLKGRLRVDGAPVQIAGVLDDLYPEAALARLGPVWERGVPSLAVWAPTARAVAVLVASGRAAGACRDEASRRVAMERGADGVWRVRGDASWRDAEYAFEVTVGGVTNVVTDPYSVALTVNSTRSLLAQLPPPGDWPKPPPIRFCDAVDLRAAHPRLLDRRHERAAGSTAGPTSRSPTPPARACGTCARSPRRA